MLTNCCGMGELGTGFCRWIGDRHVSAAEEGGEIEIDKAVGMVFDSVGLPQRLLRRLVAFLSRRVGQDAQILITDFIKAARSASGNHRQALAPEKTLGQVRLLSQFLSEKDGPCGYVCLTHDVDWIECQAFAPFVADVEMRYGMRSSFNFLTDWTYVLDRALLGDLAYEGFEIGLHGAEHDIALGYRRETVIRERISRALAALDRPVMGFRSPALSSGENLFAVLEDLRFAYDSSLATADLGFGLCFPFAYPGRNLWEIPLSLQDSTLFRDLNLTDDEGLEIAVEIMEAVVALGGVFVFNGHPGILKKHMDFYNGLIERASDFNVVKMGDIASGCQTRYDAGNLTLEPRS